MSQKTLEEKLKTIKSLAEECLSELGSTPKQSQPRTVEEKEPDSDIVLQIVNKVGDCEEADAIERTVLKKRSADARILMCLYIAYKYFDKQWLTTGDIEKITSELSVKVDARNGSNNVKGLRQYVESGSARKKGQPTPYRLNRKGAEHFEGILNATAT
mgnify:CR=1